MQAAVAYRQTTFINPRADWSGHFSYQDCSSLYRVCAGASKQVRDLLEVHDSDWVPSMQTSACYCKPPAVDESRMLQKSLHDKNHES